jgi:hypothetical protein
LRTNLEADEGLCVSDPTCTTSADCPASKTVCLGDQLHELTSVSSLSFDHLPCVRGGCATAQSNCDGDEECLGNVYDLTSIGDMCVPKCGPERDCPPDYACSQNADSPGSKPICVPGIPSVRCTADADCVYGSCIDTGAGFHVCSIPCDPTDADACALLNITSDAYFVCVESIPGQGAHCLSARTFQGEMCTVNGGVSSCGDGLLCFNSGAGRPLQQSGVCLVPCGDGNSCPARGGLNHVCRTDGPLAGACYPGNFGESCTDASQCLPGLECKGICTLHCVADTDCTNSWATLRGGHCSSEHICEPSLPPGSACSADADCKPLSCMPNGVCG